MKTALVTGGASGIGRAIADRLRADGNHVATIDLTDVGHRLQLHAPTSPTAPQIDEALTAARARWDPITILVNAAGMTSFRKFTNITSDEWAQGHRRQPERGLPRHPGGACPTCWRPVGAASSTSRRRAPTPARRSRRPTSRRSPRSTGSRKPLRWNTVRRGITANVVPPGSIDTPMLRKAEAQRPARRIGRGHRRADPGPAHRACPRTSRRPARSWSPRRPATSPDRSSASTADDAPNSRRPRCTTAQNCSSTASGRRRAPDAVIEVVSPHTEQVIGHARRRRTRRRRPCGGSGTGGVRRRDRGRG